MQPAPTILTPTPTDGNPTPKTRSSTLLPALDAVPTLVHKLSENIAALSCDRCCFGLLPDSPRPVWGPQISLAEAQLALFRAGALRFCDCEHGQRHREQLARRAGTTRSDADTLADHQRQYAERRRHMLFESAAVPPRYAAYTLESFIQLAGDDPGKQRIIQAVQAHQRDGAVSTQQGGKLGIFAYGDTGVGKTGVLSPLFLHYLHRGYSGLWVQYNELMAQFRRFEDGKVEERIAACKSVNFLFLDDFGDPAAAKEASDYSRDCMFRIIDYRRNNNLPTFVTSNLDLKQIGDQFHRRIARRLADICVVIHVTGKPLV